MEIKDGVIIVTGASKGIGLAAAKLLAQKGAKIVLAGREKEALEAISREIPDSLAVRADMRKPEDIKDLVAKAKEKYGRIDVLVNNAGQGYDAPVERIDPDTFRSVFELNLMGPVIAMREAIPVMRAQGAGAIVNISSGTALMHLPNMSPYASLKRALSHMSLTAREELKDDHIAVSVVYPYITRTDFEKNTIKDASLAAEEDDREPPHPADTAEYAAGKIVEAIETGKAEVFAHEWMGKRR